MDEGLDPRKSKSRGPGDKLYIPRGGANKKAKIPKRKQLTAGKKRSYLTSFPSAAKVVAAQDTKPDKYKATTTSRTLTLNAPGWRVVRVPAPEAAALDNIRAGRVPGVALDGDVVRTFIPMTKKERKAVPARDGPVPEDGPYDAYAHFEKGNLYVYHPVSPYSTY